MDKVWPFFTGGVIIDAELEGTEILFHLLSSHSDRQNRTEEGRRDLWSGVALAPVAEEEEGKKSGIADGRAIRSVNGGSKRVGGGKEGGRCATLQL